MYHNHWNTDTKCFKFNTSLNCVRTNITYCSVCGDKENAEPKKVPTHYFHIGLTWFTPSPSCFCWSLSIVLNKTRVVVITILHVHCTLNVQLITCFVISKKRLQGHLGHLWSSTSIDHIILVIFLIRCWSHVERVKSVLRRRKNAIVLILVEVWSGTPLVVNGFSTMFCFFSV